MSVTSSDPAGSALLAHGCASRDVELLEVMKRALLLGNLQWMHGKGGVARRRLDERSLSGITSQLP